MTATVAIGALVGASAVLGLLREALIAGRLGATWHADLLFVALLLPVVFENVIGVAWRDAATQHLGALRVRNPAEAARAERRQLGLAGAVGVVGTIVVAAASPLLIGWLAPGWGADERLAARGPFVAASILIAVQTLVYLQAAMLSIRGRVVLPNFRMPLLNIATILGLLLWSTEVTGVVLTLLGGLVLFAIGSQIVLRRHPEQAAPLTAPAPVQGAWLDVLTPVVAASLLQQLCVVAERWFASSLEAGSITQLALSFRIASLPVTLVAFAVIGARLPAMTRAAATNERNTVEWLLARMVVGCLVLSVPTAVVLVAASSPIATLLLQRGRFDAQDVQTMAPLLSLYSTALPALALGLLWTRALLVQRRGRALVAATLLGSATTIALDAALVGTFGASGLAMAFSIGAWVLCLAAAAATRRALPLHLLTIARWCVAGAAAIGAALGFRSLGLLEEPSAGAAAGLVAIVVLAVVLLLSGELLASGRTLRRAAPTREGTAEGVAAGP